MIQYKKTEGIIINLIPFREADLIVVVFTADAGIIKLMCYGIRSQRSKWRGLCRTLTCVEIIYREKNSELFEFRDMTLIDSFDNLKLSYIQMEAACDLLYALNRSQLPGKAAPKLYALLTYYLKKMVDIANPWVLSLSFRLKLLRHEGLLDYPFHCEICGVEVYTTGSFYQHEFFCSLHANMHGTELDEKDLESIYLLMACQTYKDLRKLSLSSEIKNKVFLLFDNCLAT